MFIHVQDVRYLEDYKIELRFSDGKNGIADLKDELYGNMFEPLKDKNIFSKVKIDKELETIVWDNGADLAPEFLYYKSFENDKSLQNKFKEWGYII